MILFLFTLIILTLLFSITALAAFIFRKTALKGKEGAMYYVWLAVLIFAVVPVRIGEPRFVLFPQDNPYYDINTQNTMPKLSELISYAHIPELPEFMPETAAEPGGGFSPAENNAPVLAFENAENGRGLNLSALIKNNAAPLLFALWLAGFLFAVLRIAYNYFKIKKLFYTQSDICGDAGVNAVFNECLEIAGIKRGVSLRVIRGNFASPCVCGFFEPAVFIDGGCLDLNAEKLKYIFAHELCHIKRRDMLYKILAVIVLGVHWFNPLCRKVLKAADEDCELSVDRQVMNIFGSEHSGYYMNIILDVAEQRCAENNRTPVKIPSAGLFFGEIRNIKFLNRRYANMKNITNKKRLIIALAIFLAVMIPFNIMVMSACGVTGTTASAAQPGINNSIIYNDSNVYEAALKLYFGLLPNEELTPEQLGEITDITAVGGIKTDGLMQEVIGDVPLENLTPVSFVINGREFDMVPPVVHKRFFEEYILEKIAETFVETSRELQKLQAYYSIKDAEHPELEPEAREELLLNYPQAAEYPIAVFDPNASEREYAEILGYFAAAGLLDDCFVQNGELDAGFLTKLPNLNSINFINLGARNLELLPDNIEVSFGEISIIYINDDGTVTVGSERLTSGVQNAANQYNGPSGVYEHPNYGVNTVTEGDQWSGVYPIGTEYLEFKNLSLRSAIAEYFTVNDDYPEYFDFLPWLPLTLEMISEIKSVSVRRVPEYDIVFDIPEMQPPLKMPYLEYTINGKTLGVIPEFIRVDMGDLLNADEFLTETVFNEHGLLYYSPRPDLSEEDKNHLIATITGFGLARIAVYVDEDGEYFTVGRPDLTGFSARYYDRSEYDASDTAYFPNLQEFGVEGLAVR